MKLLEKERRGAKVSKKATMSAKTPFQRILLSDEICQAKKDTLTLEYETLDPVSLLAQMELLQDELWQYSWNKKGQPETELIVTKEDVIDHSVACDDESSIQSRYYRSSKKIDLRSAPRTWRTRKDPFEKTWDEIRLRLELMPETGGKELIQWLMSKYPGEYSVGQTRTLQRRIAHWRQEQGSQEVKMRALLTSTTQSPLPYSITPAGVQPRLGRGNEDDEIAQPTA